MEILLAANLNKYNFLTFFSFLLQYDKYSNHENRPKNLLLKSVTTNVPNQQQQQQDLILGTYFPDSKELTGIDLDINVHAIKNLLMATRVNEFMLKVVVKFF